MYYMKESSDYTRKYLYLFSPDESDLESLRECIQNNKLPINNKPPSLLVKKKKSKRRKKSTHKRTNVRKKRIPKVI